MRTERALKEDLACAVMKAYRIVAPQKLEEHPALASTLPRLSPEPGHTPDPVAASGSHIPPSTTHITHAASTDPDIEYYVLEGLIGEEWNEDDAVHLGRHNAGEPNEFTITFGLAQPGSAVVYKVYAVLDTGRRAGSEAIVVRRV